MRRAISATALVVAGLAASACSSSAPSHGATTTSTRATTTTTVATTTTSSAPSTTTTPGPQTCSQVRATVGQSQGAAGTIVVVLTLAEVGEGTCTIKGYPALTRYAGSAVVPIKLVDGLTVNLPGAQQQPPALVTLTPTQGAAITVEYSDVVTGTESSCASSSSLTVTTPGADAPSPPVALTMAPCNGGTVEVSPVYAAS